MKPEWETDEDELIAHLTAHRDVVTWLLAKLKAVGIACERTRGNDKNGDILYYNSQDEAKVKQLVRNLNPPPQQ